MVMIMRWSTNRWGYPKKLNEVFKGQVNSLNPFNSLDVTRSAVKEYIVSGLLNGIRWSNILTLL